MTNKLYDTIFDPFSPNRDTGNNDSFSYHIFENIRVNCSFHVPSVVQNVITNSSDKFNVLHINARSIVNKMDDLNQLLVDTGVVWQIISISETWLPKSLENHYKMPGYRSFFCERSVGVGGGSGLYIAENLCPENLQCPSFTSAEVICTSIKLNNHNLVICQIYRSPNSNKYKFIDELEQCLIWLNKLNKTIVMTGDFNFDLLSIETSAPAQLFFSTLLSHGLFPTISRTTRSSSSSSTLIDNIFCNDLSKVAHSGIILNDISDHFPIFASLSINVNSNDNILNKSNKTLTFDYKRIDEFNQFLSEKLQTIENETCPEFIANKIIATYNEGMAQFSYMKTNSRRNNPRHPWMSPAILQSTVHKNDLFQEKLKNPSPSNVLKYNRYRNTLTRVIRLAKRKYYLQEFEKHSGNSKETWKTLQTLIKSKQGAGHYPSRISDGHGNTATSDADIAEMFNEFFTEIGENLRLNIPKSSFDPLQLVPNIEQEMQLEPTTEQELTRIIKSLNNVGAGVDSINSKLFKLSFTSILKPLLHFFNRCLITGIFPSTLKVAIIKPIFKSGDTSQVNNYRPISILPVMSKVLEKLIYCRLTNHLNQNNIIHENQFGFQKEKSTYMPILLLQDFITEAFEKGEYALGLYLDIKKAFDTVNLDLLLKKLHKYGVRHTSFQMMSSYLTGRTQSVKINNVNSTTRNVTMGVPQGSILGPILFLVYINDLPKLSPQMTCLSFADDTAILFKGSDVDDLQLTVDALLLDISAWFNANFLSLNVSKTYTQHYTTRTSDFKLNIHLNNKSVDENDNIRYLGVYIDKSLKFNKHIHHISNIVSRNIGIISRVRYYIDYRTAHMLYNSLILPYLQYCCMIWGNNYDSQLNKLITLQKRAIRLIDCVYPPVSSAPIFKKYKLLKLTDIAKLQLLLVMHRFITKRLPDALIKLYDLHPAERSGTRLVQHLLQPFSNRNYRLFTSRYLGPKLWNDLMTQRFTLLSDIPQSKLIIKNIIKKQFLANY